ncbi:glycosyl transferase [Rhodoferax koreense]|uniref:Glycosyl transferase n=1 Tax=Rhodoferax koreensis TaxID=1842727 RepID=A0A1P8JS35_9BURK|nr:glycosyltransferase family 2 protein [Rhodoferax koreense]APW36535.1 glycosyl transferase [Rhodoferax koreense]
MQRSATSRLSVTVSIVSHGHLELALPLLQQLDTYSHTVIDRVLLTINIPEKSDLADLALRFPVDVINNRQPKGFGANHNHAFLACKAPWFLILNPDIRLTADVLGPLVTRADAKSGLLAPRIIEPGKMAPENHRALITPKEILSRHSRHYQSPAVPVWIPGMFMLFRSKTFAEINGFDERFFMYGEDFDICARARLAGWQLQVDENLRAIHDARRASHKSHRHLYWHVASLLKVWMSAAFWRYRKLCRYSASI